MSGLYTRLCSGLLFPLHEWMKGHDTVARRRFLEQSQWWPREKIEALQLARLRALLRHAGSRVPFYRERFRAAGFDPEGLTCLADLAHLPMLDKADIRAHTERLKSEDAGPLQRLNTGGSSGEPLIFYVGRARVSHDVAAKWRATRWWGVDIGDPEIVVWGSPIELSRQDRLRQWRDRLLRSHLLPAFEFSEGALDRYLATLRALRPRMLFGYPSSLAFVARHAERRGIPMDDLGVKVAFVTSERLYDDQRALIGRVFACPVANGYGGRDAGFIAHECPSGGMHLSAEDIVVEIVDEAGRPRPAGQAGEIVVTHLATADFPFIRYRTGDVGVLSPRRCSCGRGLPLLEEIQGRTTDFVVAEDGTVMHGLALIYVVRDVPGVRQFKIVQESTRLTRLLLATEAGFDEGRLPTMIAALRRRLGTGVEIRVERLAEIPRETSGKYRYVVSKVAP